MSIKIHHGPPGSYKTSGAIWDDLVPQMKAGRHIVTNIRGFTRERAIKVFPQLPASFDVTFVDSSSPEGAEKWCNFFHWAPLGAFIFVDEAQNIFLRDERSFKPLLKLCDEPGRPKDWQTSWTMHRHFNWDFVLTCQNLDQLRDDIKQVSEGCYKHKNNALLGLKGRYTEGFHTADVTGRSSSHFLNVRSNIKINKKVFDLYESTSTGIHSDTIAGTPIWKNPRVFIPVALAATAIGWALFRTGGDPFHPLSRVPLPTASGPQGTSTSGQSPALHADPLASVKGGQTPVTPGGIWSAIWRMSGSWAGPDGKERFFVEVTRGDGIISTFSDVQLLRMGYRIKSYAWCSLILQSPDSRFKAVDCLPFSYVPDPRQVVNTASSGQQQTNSSQ